jgi:hypothetical protein
MGKSKDNTKATAWKIVDDYYMEVVPDAGGIQTKMQFGDCQCILSGVLLMLL